MGVAGWFLLCALPTSALGQAVPDWSGMPPDRVALTQQTMVMSMRLLLESQIEVEGLDVTWGQSPRNLRKRLDEVVDGVMELQGARSLPGFYGFSETVEWLLEDVEELDERDVLRGGGRLDRSAEERFYVLVQGRLYELELQLALELGVFERSGLWERIVSAAGWDLPADPGMGQAMDALDIPLSSQTLDLLSSEDEVPLPRPPAATPEWVGQLAELLGASRPAPSFSPVVAPELVALNLPESFDVPFASGSAVLDLNARMQLAEVRDLMGAHPELRVVCTGHADANGTRRTNEELSKVRAEAVRAKLLESGVDPSRVLMNYFGEDRAGWSPEEDRRVEVRFYWEAR